ncbi:MAG: ABC transporter ATP-binding protein [Acidobacteria bacterium]|nr:ABC transporter ATP-binding protein [Acidobacteriota bacterium]
MTQPNEIRKLPRPKRANFRKKVGIVWTNASWVLREARASSAGAFYGVVTCRVVNSAVPAGLALVGRGLINAVVDGVRHPGRGMEGVLPWIVASLALVLVMELVGLADRLLYRRLEESLSLRIDLLKLEHAASLDVSQVEDPEFQDIAERARQNSNPHFIGFLNRLLTLGTDILKIVGLTAILVYIDALTVLVTLPILVPFLLFKWSVSKTRYWKEYARANKRRWMRYFMTNLTSRTAVGEVRILRLAPIFIRRYREMAEDFIREDHRLHRRDIWGTFYLSLAYTFIFYLLFYRIVSLVIGRVLTVGDLTIIAASVGRLRDLLASLATQFTSALEQTLYIDNLAVLLAIEPKIPKSEGKRVEGPCGEIVLEDVSFRYTASGPDVLSRVSLRIAPGETVALVGENGAGKTTLVKLLARLYDPREGRLLLGGVDLRELSLEDHHRRLAYVFQEPNRFEATAEENIAYGQGCESLGPGEAETIGREAGIDDFVRALPRGYATPLGRTFGTTDLSGGQWQRLAIARALARKDATILILDEPTASLDARAEYDLFLRFRELAAGRTTVLISHRFSTVSLADRIIVLHEGRVEETGSHDELLALGGRYATLYRYHRAQMDGEALL